MHLVPYNSAKILGENARNKITEALFHMPIILKMSNLNANNNKNVYFLFGSY